MATDVVVRTEQAATQLTNEQLRYISTTEFVPPGLRGNLPAILACVATGRELGIGDMVALRSIHIIDGKATFSAELMVQLVRRHGHSIVGEVSGDSATITGTRGDNGDTMRVVWTLAMAERAGLLSKGNWRKYPEAMLWARGVSQLCRMLFADCFAGNTYTTEELGEEGIVPEPVDISDAIVLEDSAGVGGDSTPQATNELAAPAEPPSEPEETVPRPSDAPDARLADSATSGPEDDPPITPAQKKKLNVMVVQLRNDGHITTEMLWRSVGLDPELGRGEDGELHWAPLRDRLRKFQAMALIDRLGQLEARVKGPEGIDMRGAVRP